MKKVENTLIVLFVLFIVFLGSILGIKYYQASVLEYNSSVQYYSLEVMKGNLSRADIGVLPIDDSVKVSLQAVYDEMFYRDDEIIVVYEGVSELDKYIDYMEENYTTYEETYALLREEIGNYTLSSVVEEGDVGPTEEELAEKADINMYYNMLELLEYSSMFVLGGETNATIVDDNIVITAGETVFDKGSMKISYRGYQISFIRDIQEKLFRDYVSTSEKYSSITLNDTKVIDNYMIDYLTDYLDNQYTIVYELSRGKIYSVSF